MKQVIKLVVLTLLIVVLGGCTQEKNNTQEHNKLSMNKSTDGIEKRNTDSTLNLGEVQFLKDHSVKYTWKGNEYCLPSNQEDCNTDNWKNGGVILLYYQPQTIEKLKKLNKSKRYFFAEREDGYCGTDAYLKATVLVDKETGKFLSVDSTCSDIYGYGDISIDPYGAEAEDGNTYGYIYRIAEITDDEITLEKFKLNRQGKNTGVNTGYFCEELKKPVSPLSPFDDLADFEKIGKKVEVRKVILNSLEWSGDEDITKGTQIKKIFGKQLCSEPGKNNVIKHEDGNK